MATIEVTAQRSGKRWILHAPKPNSFASAARLADAPAAITRQIASDHDLDPSTIEVNVTPVIDAQVSRLIDDLAGIRRRNEEAIQQQHLLTAEVAHLLIAQMDLTYRDAAYLLELSHQRVHQIVSETATCGRCKKTTDINDPTFTEWEATAGGDAVICPDCLTPEEQQAIDEDDMAMMDLIEERRLAGYDD